MATIFLSLLNFIRFSVPSLEVSEWNRLNKELKQSLAPLHALISQCTSPDDLNIIGNKISLEIHNLCMKYKELFAEETKRPQEFFNHQNQTIAQLEKV